VKDFKKLIKNQLKSVYGDEEGFGLIHTGQNHFILITPFIDDGNNLIELSIAATGSSNIIISENGRIKNYLEKVNLTGGTSGASTDLIAWLNNIKWPGQDEKSFVIKTDSKKIGQDIEVILKLLHKVYSIKPDDKIEELKPEKTDSGEKAKFGYYLKNSASAATATEDGFRKDFTFLLNRSRILFEENASLALGPENIKFHFKIPGFIKKYINLISVPDFNKAEELIKTYCLHYSKLNSFKNSFYIVFNDKDYPAVWHKLKNTGSLEILKSQKIHFFGLYQDISSLRSCLLKRF